MIFNNIIDAIYKLFTWFIDLFPLIDYRVIFIPDSIYNMKLLLARYNWIFPVYEFYKCIDLMIILLLSVATFKFVRWLASIVTINILH